MEQNVFTLWAELTGWKSKGEVDRIGLGFKKNSTELYFFL